MINDDFKEVLGELVNISFGHATAAIADLFDNFATLHVPKIEVLSLAEINSFMVGTFGEHELYVTTQQFRGEFQGEIAMVINPESAAKMNHVIGEDDNSDENELKQNLLEIANILGVTCLSQLAELLEAELSFSPPSIELSRQLIQDIKESPYNKIIIISTVLSFEELDIRGDLFIMCNDDMLTWLLNAVNEFIEKNM